MAQWIFTRPPQDCQETETTFAVMLSAQLDEDWVIRWGYHYKDGAGVSREGDFLILGPTGGVCVCEVKTSLHVSTKSGEWQDGRKHPFDQLLAQHHSVIRNFSDNVHAGAIPYIQKALVCPQIEVDRKIPEHHTIPTEFILDGNDCEDFLPAWNRIFNHRGTPVTQDQREAFMDLYASHLDPKRVKHLVSHTDAQILRLTLANYSWLESLANNQQILVEGGAGSGKTWMAVQAAKKYAENQGAPEGQRVLMVVYNIALSQFLKSMLYRGVGKRGSIELFTYEELCEAICKTAGIDLSELRKTNETSEYYGRHLPAAVALALDSSPEVKETWIESFDALVIDEAQDHNTALPLEIEGYPLGYWSFYAKLLKQGFASRMFIAGDSHQRPPFREDGGFNMMKLREVLSQDAHLSLRQTKRYTRQIAKFLKTLRKEGSKDLANDIYVDATLLDGPDVEEEVTDANQARSVVESILNKWQEEGLCECEDVLILYDRSILDRSVLAGIQKLAKHPMKPYLETLSRQKEPSLAHSSVHKAKGIDSRAVILVGMPPYSQLESEYDQFTYFMGASRARQLLACVHVES